MSTQGRIATHVAAALVGGAVVLLCVKTRTPTSHDGSESAATKSSAPIGATSPSASGSAGPRDAGPVRSIPVIVKFNVPNPAVNVTQRDNGTLEVVNSDPKLSGTQLAIEGITSDGRVLTFDVRVPAPRAH